MAKRKGEDVPQTEDADLMAVVEATEPVVADPAPDTAPERVMEAPVAPPPERRSGGGAFLGMVLGGVIAAGAGFGIARFMPDLLPVATDTGLAETVEAQAAEIAALREQVASLPQKPAADTDIEARLAALEAASTPDLSGVEGRLAALEAKVDGLGSGPSGASPEMVAELQALKDQVARLGAGGTVPADVTAAAEAAEARLKEAEARAVAMAQEAQAAAVASRRSAALDRVAAALDSGAPYQGALRDLGADVPPVLVENAAAGLPTVAELADAFPTVARDALEAALRANMGESWTERVSNFLRSQTGLRSLSPREGNDPDAILSRAEAALESGNVSVAVKELDAMPDAGKPALAEWLARAQLRVEAEAAFAALAAN